MIRGEDLQLLRSGETVLVHFLHDALSRIEDDYFNKIVVPFLASDHYRGSTSVMNKRGVAKSSLKEFDLQFLLQLFEFAVDRRKSSGDGLIKPDLTTFLPLTQSTVHHKVRAAIAVRNDWVHADMSAYDETRRAIDITKLLDLFREEVFHVVMTREEVFSSDTRKIVSDYAAELTSAMLRPPVGQMQVEQDVASIPEPLPNDASWAAKLGRYKMLLTAIGVVLMGALLIFVLLGKQPDKAPFALHVAMCEPVTKVHEATVRMRLSELIESYTLDQIVVHSSDNLPGAVFSVGHSDEELDAVLGYLQKGGKLGFAFQFRKLFDHVIPAMNVAGDSSSSVLVLGSVGQFTRQEERALSTVPDTLFPAGTGRTLRRSKAPLLFLRLGSQTESDNRVLKGFKEASITCKELVP